MASRRHLRRGPGDRLPGGIWVDRPHRIAARDDAPGAQPDVRPLGPRQPLPDRRSRRRGQVGKEAAGR
jgi:hypothetical protein